MKVVKVAIAAIGLACGSAAMAQSSICSAVEGAKIVASDGKYLGVISNKYDSNSIYNKYGEYGNKYNSNSIWNKYGEYGNKYNSLSWSNRYSSDPPKIIKGRYIIGYLTENKSISGGINPIIIGITCYDYDPG